MKRAAVYLLIAAAVAGGVFVALRADKWLESRQVSSIDSWWGRQPTAPVALELQGGAVDFRAAAKKVIPSVVSVDRLERYRGLFDDEVRIAQTGSGSGVIVSEKGYILTNNHVVAGADRVRVRLPDDRSVDANVIGTDPRSDLAVLKVEATGLVPAEMGSSSKLEIGEWVLAVGNPLGFNNTVSVGVVSNLNRTLDVGGPGLLVDAIQTDAAINRGNSGGALANAKGQVVGINSVIASDTGGNVGLGFAIPIDRAKRVVSDIIQHGRVRYGVIGAVFYRTPGLLSVEAARAQLREAAGAEPPRNGLIVRSVQSGGGASRAGIGPMDVVTEVNGVKLTEYADLMKVLMDKRAGDRVSLKVWSKGSTRSVEAVLYEPL